MIWDLRGRSEWDAIILKQQWGSDTGLGQLLNSFTDLSGNFHSVLRWALQSSLRVYLPIHTPILQTEAVGDLFSDFPVASFYTFTFLAPFAFL